MTDYKNDYEPRKRLKRAGWDVSKPDTVSFNAGSETRAHVHLKLSVAWYLKYECGYRVDTEVEMSHGEVDVLGYKADDIIIVECETKPTDDVVSDKINRYVEGQPPRECWVLPVEDCPADIHEAYKWIKQELGL